jgi:hypothetical protein
MIGTDIQEAPESTVGRKPPRRPPPWRSRVPPEDPFARARVRREEAEESDLGGEIRGRDEGDAPEEGPLDYGEVGSAAGARLPERKPSVP